MKNYPNYPSFIQSLSSEVESQATRVRDLIGDRHYLSDGRHKEAVLMSVLSRHIQSSVCIGNGFVISPIKPQECSREQDIIVVDTFGEPPILQQHGFLISSPSNLVASISVKTTLRKSDLTDALNTINSLSSISSFAPRDVWSCAFFYNTTENSTDEDVTRIVKDCVSEKSWEFMPNIISTASDYIFALCDGSEQKYIPFRCNGEASGFVIATLIDHLAARRVKSEASIHTLAESCHFDVIGDRE